MPKGWVWRRGSFLDFAAIKNSQAQFVALGHPFVDAVLRHVGSYDFGGHTTVRVIQTPMVDYVRAGYQFNLLCAPEWRVMTATSICSTSTRWRSFQRHRG